MTGTVALIFGLVIIAAAVVLLVKQYETKTVLLGAGFLMAIAALSPLQAFDAFSKNMVAAKLIQNICSTLGFAAVLQITRCDKHLIYAMAGGLAKVRPLLIPGAIVATFVINIALPSAAGCAAAVGVILIPLLISQGVSPAVAATAVFAGTFGGTLSPGVVHYAIISDLTKIEVIDLIKEIAPAVLACLVINTVFVTLIAKFRKEDRGYKSIEESTDLGSFKINYFLALLPLTPVILLVLFSLDGVKTAMPWTKDVIVPHVMLFGAFLCILFTKTSPTSAVKDFFNGMGKGYADIIGIIIAAGVFISGMRSLGIIDAFIAFLKNADHLVSVAATYGPFILGVISGSGDAATLAFNEAVTPHAGSFGFSMSRMGTLAMLAGSLGRTMSPIAGAAIICAGIAKVNPFELAKRNAPGMLAASIAAMIIMLY